MTSLVDFADDPEYIAYMERWTRAGNGAGRDRKSGWGRGGVPRCSGCAKFIPNRTSVCHSCGYDNGLRRYAG